MRRFHIDGIHDRLALALLGIVAVFVAATFRDYGLSWDDYTHSEYGDLLVAYFSSGLSDRRVFDFVNLYRYGGGFDLAAALLAKISPFTLFETRRLLGGIVGLIGIAVTWRIGRRIGGPLAGLVAAALLAACPLYIGHMMMNPKDAPFAVAMALLLLGLIRVMETYPRPSRSDQAMFAVGLGLAVGTRILAGLNIAAAVGALAVLLGTDASRQGWRFAWRRLGRFILTLIPAAIVAYLIVAVVWPWGVADPLNPIRALGYFSRFFEEPWREMFGGHAILVTEMPRNYLPVLLALKLPEIMVLLGLGGLAAAFTQRDPRKGAALVMVSLAVLVPVGLTVIERPAMYNGIRHFIFILPPIAALGGYGAAWLWERLSPALRYAGAALFAIGIASPVIEMARLHPFEYTHFNRIAGGVAAASNHYMLDYWGLSLKQASDALRPRLGEGRTRVAVCGPHRPVQVALGPDKVETTWEPKDADYAIMLGVFYCARLDAPVIAEITRAGAVYARVYDIKGRGIDNLLTLPGLTPLK